MEIRRIKFTQDTQINFANGFIKTLEKSLIRYQDFLKFAEQNIEEVKKALQEKGYSFESGSPIQNDILNLGRYLLKIFAPYEKYSLLIKLILLKYDFENLKKTILNNYAQKGEAYYFKYLYFSVLISKPQSPEIKLQKDIFKLPKDILKEINQKLSTIEEVSPVEIGKFIDSIYYSILYPVINSLKLEFIEKYYRYQIDFYNLENLIEAKFSGLSLGEYERLFMPYGSIDFLEFKRRFKSEINEIPGLFFRYQFHSRIIPVLKECIEKKDFLIYDVEKDNLFMEYLKLAKFISFGFEPVFAFLMAKEIEYKNIRIILSLLEKNIHSDEIKKVIRRTYV